MYTQSKAVKAVVMCDLQGNQIKLLRQKKSIWKEIEKLQARKQSVSHSVWKGIAIFVS